MISDALNDQFIFPGNRHQHSTSRTWRRSLRKRRANSDSELPLPLVDYGSHGIADDSVIDFLTDSSMDRIDYLMARNATMDPSQMFIGLNNSTTNIPSAPSNGCMTLDPDESHMDALVDGLDSNIPEPLFSTQFFYVDALTSNETNSEHTVPQNNSLMNENFVNTQVYGNNVTTNAPNAIQALEISESIPRHIPAKYRKTLQPGEMLINPLVPLDKTDTKEDYTINKQWVSTTTDKEELKKKGIEWKNGLWSTEEEEILRTNIDAYCEKNNIVDPTLMIFSEFKDNRKQFYRSISKGLNRTLFAVYRKVTRMYDDKNYQGRYSKEEEMRLIELCEETNCNWALIGDALGRSATSVKDKARMLRNRKKKGKWEEGELNRLSKAVHEHTSTKHGESVTSGVNWGKIAEKVNTRSEKQCFNKWLNFLNWKEAGGKKWIKTDEIELINRIANSDAKEETDLDWNNLSNGWPCVRSPQWLRNKWWKIKTNVPGYKIRNFPDLLSYLKTTYIDSIWDKCKETMLSRECSAPQIGSCAGEQREGNTSPLTPPVISNTNHIITTCPKDTILVPANSRYKQIAPKTTTTSNYVQSQQLQTLALNTELTVSDSIPNRTYTSYALSYEPLQLDLVLVTPDRESTNLVSSNTTCEKPIQTKVDQSAGMWQAWV